MKSALLLIACLYASVALAQGPLSGANGDCTIGGQQVITQGLQSSGTQPIGTTTVSSGSGVEASYPNCSVTVYLTGTLTKASIFANNLSTPTSLGNPFTANGDSSWLFFAAPTACYDIVLQTGTGPTLPEIRTFADVCLGTAAGAGTVTLVTSQAAVGTFMSTAVANQTTTPGFSYTLLAAPAYSVWGNNQGTAAQPQYVSIVPQMLPFTYSGNTLQLATVGVTLSHTAGTVICEDSIGNLKDTGCNNVTGVSSFNGRTGPVLPQTGDYLVSQVTGAAPLASPAFTGAPTAPTPLAGDTSSQIPNDTWVSTYFAVLNSPAFSGIPTAPTASPGTNTTQIATTAFVIAQIGTGYAPLNSPAFTGVPTAPTATVNTNTTQLATTAFVIGQASNITPNVDGTPAIGTSLLYARADHVHPTDSSRAPTNNPNFTGTVLAAAFSLSGTYTDSFSSVGTSGQLLSSTVVGTKWVTATGTGTVTSVAGGGIAIASPSPIVGSGSITVTGSGSTTTAATAASNVAGATTGNVITSDGSGNIQSAGVLLSSLAPLASPSFTGTATVVNLTITGTCTGCVTGAVSSVFGRTGAVVATSGDYTVSQVTGAAPLASPGFTGTPTAPTPATADNSTKIATTAYVQAQGYITTGLLPLFAGYTFNFDGTNVNAVNNATGLTQYSGTDLTVVANDAIANMTTCGLLYFKVGTYPIKSLVQENTGGYTNYYAIGLNGVSTSQFCEWQVKGEAPSSASAAQFGTPAVQTSGVIFNVTSTAVSSVTSTKKISALWVRPEAGNGPSSTLVVDGITIRFPDNQRGCETAFDATAGFAAKLTNFRFDTNVAPLSLVFPVEASCASWGSSDNGGLIGVSTPSAGKQNTEISFAYGIGYDMCYSLRSEHLAITNAHCQSSNFGYYIAGQSSGTWYNGGGIHDSGCGEVKRCGTLGTNTVAGTKLDITGFTMEDATGSVYPAFQPVYHWLENNAGDTAGFVSYQRNVAGTGPTTLSNLFDGGGGGSFTPLTFSGALLSPALIVGTAGNAGNLSLIAGTEYCTGNQPANSFCQEAAATISTAYNVIWPAAAGTVNQVLSIASVSGQSLTLGWTTVSGGSGLSGMTTGQVPVAATASTVTSSVPLQGTDSAILTAGTISGTAANLCTDANGGATTVGCTSGGNVSTGTSPNTPAQYYTAVFSNGTTLGGIGPGTTGQCLTSNGASSYPTYQPCGSGGGANVALSNLASVAVNTALLPGTTNSIALGSASFYWSNAYVTALQGGIAGTTSFVITGAGSTSGTATITWPATAGTTTNAIASSNTWQAPAINATSLTTAYQINAVTILMQPDSDTTSLAVGPSALAAQSSASLSNVAVGKSAAAAVTSADEDTAIGVSALAANTTGNGSTAVGYQALTTTSAGSNTAVGVNAGEFIGSGNLNTAIGQQAMAGVTGTHTTGANNTAIGAQALSACQGACHDNAALGYQAGNNINTGIENVMLGSGTGANAGADTNEIVIGYNLTGGGSNHVNLGGILTASGIGTPSTSTVTIPGTLDVTGAFVGTSVSATAYKTSAICTANGTAASPSVISCGSSPAGFVSCDDTTNGICKVNTSAVATATSTIVITQDSGVGATLGVTCNTTVSTVPILITARAGSTFTFQVTTPSTNPDCFDYFVIN